MSRSLNQCNFIGNLGADPESRYTPSGDCVATFSIGVSDDYTKDGQKVEQTDWIRVVAWRKLGENCAQYLAKGSKVFVTGKMKTRSYEKDGNKVYVTEIVANDVQFLDARGGDQQQAAAPARQHRPAQQQAQDDDFGDDLIPF